MTSSGIGHAELVNLEEQFKFKEGEMKVVISFHDVLDYLFLTKTDHTFLQVQHVVGHPHSIGSDKYSPMTNPQGKLEKHWKPL